MPKCRKCGCELKPETRFCPQCGEKVVRYCPECGKELSAGAKYCPECGKDVVNQPNRQKQETIKDETSIAGSIKTQLNDEKKDVVKKQYEEAPVESNIMQKRKKIWIVAGVVIGLFVIAFISIGLNVKRGQGQKGNNNIHLNVNSREDEKYMIRLLDQYGINPIEDESDIDIVEMFLWNNYEDYSIEELCEACIENGEPSYLGYTLSDNNTDEIYALVMYGYTRDQLMVMMFVSKRIIATGNIFIEFVSTVGAEYYRDGKNNTDNFFTLDEIIEDMLSVMELRATAKVLLESIEEEEKQSDLTSEYQSEEMEEEQTIAPEYQSEETKEEQSTTLEYQSEETEKEQSTTPEYRSEKTQMDAPPIGAHPADDIGSFMPDEYAYGKDQFIREYLDNVPYSGNYMNSENGYHLHLYYNGGDHNSMSISFSDQVDFLVEIDFRYFEYGEDNNYEGTVNANYADGSTRLVTVYVEKGNEDTEIIISASDSIDIEGIYTLTYTDAQ